MLKKRNLLRRQNQSLVAILPGLVGPFVTSLQIMTNVALLLKRWELKVDIQRTLLKESL